jgi:hypothetical protein
MYDLSEEVKYESQIDHSFTISLKKATTKQATTDCFQLLSIYGHNAKIT